MRILLIDYKFSIELKFKMKNLVVVQAAIMILDGTGI